MVSTRRVGAVRRNRPLQLCCESCRFVAAMALVITLLVLVGCNRPANVYDAVVTGTVTVGGELARSGIVTFHPVDKGKPAIGRIHSDGSYSLRTGQGDLKETDGGTVEPGEYVVTASIHAPSKERADADTGGPPLPGPSLIAAKYAHKATTDQKYDVKPGRQVIVLNLERAESALVAENATDVASDENGQRPQQAPSGELTENAESSERQSADEPERSTSAGPATETEQNE